MNNKKEKVVGILGGMGPEATIDIFTDIVKHTNIENDNDHLRIIIDNNPKLPSRQDAILGGGENPGPAMALTAKNIEKAGADFIILGANTAHYFYHYVKQAVTIPVLHIIGETVLATIEAVEGIKKVGVLATKGAMKTGMFQDAFAEYGIRVIAVPEDIQELAHEAVFSFRTAGLNKKNISMMEQAASFLIANGAEAIIMGCTEIPLILKAKNIRVKLINPNEVIAQVTVNYAKNKILIEQVGDKYLSVNEQVNNRDPL
ncbi:aspartate/glutamate racemase family protein [Psychromonas sp.]|uniref:aspartate/glutamate racemase family protein n=1 Tax=Psychromonas sp. TaxID=1884585 RepID=UPI003568A81A